MYSCGAYARKTSDLDEIDESLVGELTKVEKYLLKSQDLIRVRGKVRSHLFTV